MNEDVVLAPPGAGLPTLELWVARSGLFLLAKILSRRQIERWLRSETGKVLALARRLSAEQLSRRVLVPRLLGLEDSSRHWSAAMVLQHLVIVDTGIGELVEALATDRDFGREVRIADVKPALEAGQEQMALLADALNTYLCRMTTIPDLQTRHRHAHPWFGPLDGRGWHALAALHTWIHRRQIETVAKSAAC